MKVLQINNVHYRRGGADVVYLNTAELLQQHGDEVIFFNMLKKDNLPCKDEKYWVSSLESRPKGLKSTFIELRNFFYNPEAEKKIEELIIAEHPDIAHIHLFWGCGISPSICKVLKKHGIPLVQTVHDYRMICPVALLMDSKGRVCEKCRGKHFYKALFSVCSKHGIANSAVMAAEMYYHNIKFYPTKVVDGFIFVSNFSYQKHCEYMPKLKNAHYRVLYNFFDTSSGFSNTMNRKYFLFYGRLSREKGILTLLKAFEVLKDIPLMVVGIGPKEEEAKQYVVEHIMSNVHFMGYQTGDNLKKLICDASYVIVPSECYENNPMTIVEAYSMGVPIIGAKIGGIPEIIDEGETGFLFEPKNIDDLRESVIRAKAVDEETYVNMSNKTKQYANQHFNAKHYYKKLIEFYEEIIKH